MRVGEDDSSLTRDLTSRRLYVFWLELAEDPRKRAGQRDFAPRRIVESTLRQGTISPSTVQVSS